MAGPKKRFYATVLSSSDGSTWAVSGSLTQPDYAGLDRAGGGDGGIALVMRTARGGLAVLRSADARTWQRADLAPGRTVQGLAAFPGTAVLAGGPGLLSGASGEVDLTRLPGAVHPDRSITAVAAADPAATTPAPSLATPAQPHRHAHQRGAQRLAHERRGYPRGANQHCAWRPDRAHVRGGRRANGDAAAWTSVDGATWQRAQIFGGAAPRRLVAVAHGPRGWTAIGQNAASPLVMTSADGRSWQPVAKFPGGTTASLYAISADPAGYTIVGRDGTPRRSGVRPTSRPGRAGRGPSARRAG